MSNTRFMFYISLSLVVGFVMHDVVGDAGLHLLQSMHLVPNNSIKETVLGQTLSEDFITKVTFDGKSFHPARVIMQQGNYLVITNTSSKELLWLVSDLPGVTSTRGYAEGEQYQFLIDTIGSYTVQSKLNPKTHMTIVVHE